MTQEIINLFVEELLKEKDCYITETKGIRILIKANDPTEAKYYVDEQTNTVWRKRAWITNNERILRLRKESDEFNQKVYKRKEILSQLCLNIAAALNVNVEDENTFNMALKIMKTKNIQAANFFNVNMEELPTLEKPYQIVKGSSYYEL